MMNKESIVRGTSGLPNWLFNPKKDITVQENDQLTLFGKYTLLLDKEIVEDGDIITIHAIDKWMWLSVDQTQKENVSDGANGDAVEVALIKPGRNNEVVLRFYKYEEAFFAEIKLRDKFDLQNNFIEILLNHKPQGLGHESLSCISFENADHDLELVFNKTAHGSRSHKWFRKSKIVLRQIVIALKYLHDKGFVHGHIEPKNIAKYGMHWKLKHMCLITRIGSRMRGPLRSCIPPESVRERLNSSRDSTMPKNTLVSFDVMTDAPSKKESATSIITASKKESTTSIIIESRNDSLIRNDLSEDLRSTLQNIGNYSRKLKTTTSNLIIDTRSTKIEVLDKTCHSPEHYSRFEYAPNRCNASPEWDAWGLGLIMVQLLVGKSIYLPNFEKADDALMKNLYTFNRSNLKQIYKQVIQTVGDVDAADMVVRLLNPDPRHRPFQMGKVLKHKYFSKNCPTNR